MTDFPNRRLVLQGLAASAASFNLAATAAAWPTKPVNLLVPFPAGGGTDAFARPMGVAFAQLTGHNMIIDNKGGGGGTIGAALASKMSADGHNLFMGAIHHAIAPSVYPKLSYNLETDFVPLLLVARVPQVIVVNPKKLPVKDFQELLSLIRSRPGRLNYGSAGSGTSHHLAGELFKQLTQTFITHIPYRGAGPALQGLIAGDVDMLFDGLGSSAAHIKGGRIKALAVAGHQRNSAIPEVPSMAELGLPGYRVNTWYGIWAPQGLAADLQPQIIGTLQKAIQAPQARDAWAAQGAEFPDVAGAAFGQFVKTEMQQWAGVVKAAGGIGLD